jgi:hypothetical protein
MNVTGPIKVIIAANTTANALLAGRVYPGVIDNGRGFPAMAVTRASTEANATKTGVSNVDFVRVQLDIFAKTYGEAEDVSEAVRTALDFYSGSVVSGGDTVNVDHIDYLGTVDNFENTPELHRVIAEYIMHIKR